MNKNTLPATLIARSPHGKCSVAWGLASACARNAASALANAPDEVRGLAAMRRATLPRGGRPRGSRSTAGAGAGAAQAQAQAQAQARHRLRRSSGVARGQGGLELGDPLACAGELVAQPQDDRDAGPVDLELAQGLGGQHAVDVDPD